MYIPVQCYGLHTIPLMCYTPCCNLSSSILFGILCIYIYAFYILQCVACWIIMYSYVLCQKWRIKHVQSIDVTLQWRHNGRDSVSNHQPLDCLLNGLFRHRSKKTSKLRVTGFGRGIHRWLVNSPHKWPVTRKMFPFDDVIMKESTLDSFKQNYTYPKGWIKWCC